MAQVTLEHVGKVYPGDVRAVKDFNLTIEDGEFIVMVGPSGCGKSTTLRMVAGLEEISEGTIKIGGRVVNDVLPKDRNIAMVFQNYALYPDKTVYENMAFCLRMRKYQPEDDKQRKGPFAPLINWWRNRREKNAEIDRRGKIAKQFSKAFELAIQLDVTEENIRIWTELTRMTLGEIEDNATEARELAKMFTDIADHLDVLAKEREVG